LRAATGDVAFATAFGALTTGAFIAGFAKTLGASNALTNLLGNGVATIVVARWEGQLDLDRAKAVLSRRAASEPVA